MTVDRVFRFFLLAVVCPVILGGCRGFRDRVETVKEEHMRAASFSMATGRTQLERGILIGRVMVETEELSFKELRWDDGYSEREDEPFHRVPKIRDDVDAKVTATLLLGKVAHGLEIEVDDGRFEIPLADFREIAIHYEASVDTVVVQFDSFQWGDRTIEPDVESVKIPIPYFHAMKAK